MWRVIGDDLYYHGEKVGVIAAPYRSLRELAVADLDCRPTMGELNDLTGTIARLQQRLRDNGLMMVVGILLALAPGAAIAHGDGGPNDPSHDHSGGCQACDGPATPEAPAAGSGASGSSADPDTKYHESVPRKEYSDYCRTWPLGDARWICPQGEPR